MVTRVITSITKDTSAVAATSTALSLMKIDTTGTIMTLRESIKNLLLSMSSRTAGENFLVVVSIDVVEIVMEYAKAVGLVTIKNQWLYVISDGNKGQTDISHLTKLLGEGDNVAFIYNTTSHDATCMVCFFMLMKKFSISSFSCFDELSFF